MKIRLIEPSCYLKDGRPRRTRLNLVPSMTLPYLAALTPPEFEISIVRDWREDIDYEEKVDLVGLTANSFQIRRAYDIAAEYRKRRVPVVLGGIHASLIPEEAMARVDTLFVGEAEETWPAFLQDFKSGTPKKIYQSSAPPSLDRLPAPRWDLLRYRHQSQFLNLYRVLIYLFAPSHSFFRPVITVQTSRGCPNSCQFCVVTKFFGSKTRYRPVSDVIQEIRSLQAKVCFFTDDNLFENPDRAGELLRALKPLNIVWFGFAPIAVAEHPNIVALARESGCVGLIIGLESLSDKNLESVGKKVNRTAAYGANLKILRRAGIPVFATMMFGFDHETKNVFQDTFDFLTAHRVPFPQEGILRAYPGTAVYERLKSQGRLLDEKWWLSSHRSVNNLDYTIPEFDNDEFLEQFYAYYQKAYSVKNILQRILIPPHKWALPMIFLSLYFRHNLRKSRSILLD